MKVDKLDPFRVPCLCGPRRRAGHLHGCPRGVAEAHPEALYFEHDTYAVLYPGTLCEWPENGHGSGRGRESFICMHCGQGHDDHGLGDSYTEIHEHFKTPQGLKHRVCKIFVRLPEREAPSVYIELEQREILALLERLDLPFAPGRGDRFAALDEQDDHQGISPALRSAWHKLMAARARRMS